MRGQANFRSVHKIHIRTFGDKNVYICNICVLGTENQDAACAQR